MNRRTFLQGLGIGAGAASIGRPRAAGAAVKGGRPNFIIVFNDDQGYQDLGCFGSPKIKTPHVDAMAQEGMRFTDFYVGASVCTPSRAALLTGCYPERVGNLPVLFPHSDRGLNPAEHTMADLLKAQGYATACIGKWHLGHLAEFLPTRQGFDCYYGIPYSNDMWLDTDMPLAEDAVLREGVTRENISSHGKSKRNKVPLMRNEEVIEYPADQTTITRRSADEAIAFIEKHRDRPFFVYLANTMPHIPLYASDRFRGTSDAGLYGDCIEEIDWNAGRILKKLKELNIDEKTFVVFTSDNGPWKLKQGCKVKGNMNRRVGGSADPLRGYKFSQWEGGMREPTVMWWPGTIPAGTECREPVCSMDLLPTFVKLAGGEPPADRPIDGLSIIPLITGAKDAKTPHEAIFYRKVGVRSGKWKYIRGKLFDLQKDIAEQNDVAKDNPAVVARLKKLLDDHRREMKEHGRPAGRAAGTAKGLPGWKVCGGNFRVENGVLKQAKESGETAVFAPGPAVADYTLEVRGRAVKGKEGFRVMVRAQDMDNYYRWSTGAFGNEKHSLMVVSKGKVTERDEFKAGTVSHGQWHDLRVAVRGDAVTCFLDGTLTNEAAFGPCEKGGVGLGSCNTAVEFRDLKVTAPDGTVLLEGF